MLTLESGPCGWYPWWRRRAQRGDQLAVQLHARAMYRRDGDSIPNGELVPPGPHPWDDCFTRLGDPPAVPQWPRAATATWWWRVENG